MVITELYIRNFGKLSERHFYLKNGVQIEIPAVQMQSQQFLARVRKFALSLEQFTREEKEDTLLEENSRQ